MIEKLVERNLRLHRVGMQKRNLELEIMLLLIYVNGPRRVNVSRS